MNEVRKAMNIEMSKNLKKKPYTRIQFISIVTLSLLIFGNPIYSDKPFDRTKVQSKDCQDGKYSCGFNPTNSEIEQSIPIAESTQISHRGLPSRVDFGSKLPPVVNQGQQNSCVAFSVGYYTQSYLQNQARNWGYDTPAYGGAGTHVFSPAYIYNQINGGQDNGSYFDDALKVVIQQGIATWAVMPYSEKDYRTKPNQNQKNQAANFKSESYRRLPFDNLQAVKSELASGRPVIFGMTIDDAFYNLKGQVYDKPSGRTYGGHAMTLVGYDDSKVSPKGDKGAFKLINSWGKEWGDKGFGWVSYKQWIAQRPYSYVLIPPENTNTTPSVDQEVNQVVQGNIASPADVKASQGSYSNQIQVSWSVVQSALAYGITRAEPGQDSFKFLAYSNQPSYNDTKVQVNSTYRYKVIAIGETSTSDAASAPIASGYAGSNQQSSVSTVPGIEIQLISNQSSYRVSLNWSVAPGADYYQVRRWNAATETWQVWNQKITTQSFVDSGPIAGANNRYSVRAANSAGQGPWSSVAEISVPGGQTVPAKPANLVVSNGTFKDRIVVKWSATAGTKMYYIFRYDYSQKKWEGPIEGSATNEYIDTAAQIKDGQFYAYTVVAMNEVGSSDYADPAVGRANPLVQRAGQVLDAPTNIEAKINEKSNQVTVRWQAVKGASSYVIMMKPKGAKEYSFVETVNAPALQYTGKFTGKVGELYFYTVRSVEPSLNTESADGKPAVAFVNKEIDMVSHRFMPGQGLERFSGEWHGRFWNGKTAPRNIALKIDGDMGGVNLSFSDDGGKKTSLNGSYPAMADQFSLKGIEVQYREDLDVIIVKANESFAFLPNQTISFTR